MTNDFIKTCQPAYKIDHVPQTVKKYTMMSIN